MKFLVMAGILLFAGIGSAAAQAYVGAPGSGSSVGAGPSLNGGTGINGAGAINGASPTNSTVGSDSQPSRNVQATNPGEFVPSTFENYDAAVGMGEDTVRFRPLSVVEAARRAQQAKASAATKPAIFLEKDSEGKLIVVQSK
jgi:hypothetical protein